MRKIFTLASGLLILLSVMMLPAKGQISSQENVNGGFPLENYNGMFGTSINGIGQIFKTQSAATLGIIEFFLPNFYIAGTVNIEVYECSARDVWGSLIQTKTGIPVTSSGWISADLTSLAIPLAASSFYGFRILGQFEMRAQVGVGAASDVNGSVYLIDDNTSPSAFEGYLLTHRVFAAVALPVKLSSFTAETKGVTTLLKWSTVSEQNSKDFTIQHGTDGTTWSNIGTVAALGNSNSLHNYSYVVSKPVTGKSYYRLMQTDLDGKSTFTEVRTASFTSGVSSFVVLANPVRTGVLQVQVNEAGSFSLYNPAGLLVWTKELTAGKQSLDMSKYGRGIFVLKGEQVSKKISVE